MYKLVILIHLLLLVLIFPACKDELIIRQKDFPFFLLDSVRDINRFGAVLSVNWLEQGKEPCTDYGLVWTLISDEPPSLINKKANSKSSLVLTNKEAAMINDSIFSIKGNPKSEKILINLNGRLNSNSIYSARAYARTFNNLVYSNQLFFRTLINAEPIVTGYDKDTVHEGSILTIFGLNFKPAPCFNFVYLYQSGYYDYDGHQCKVDSSSLFKLIVTVPSNLEQGDMMLRIKGDSTWYWAPKGIYFKSK